MIQYPFRFNRVRGRSIPTLRVTNVGNEIILRLNSIRVTYRLDPSVGVLRLVYCFGSTIR
ncbi:hypothetical protein V6Z12_D13G152200 [Gossypium hirsutum]